MSASSKMFSYNGTPFSNCHRTVVQMANGKFLEVRRDDITWTAAFRAANPDVKQCIFDSLQAWHASFYDQIHNNVSVWKMSRDEAAPLPAGEDSYWLDFQLSTFIGAASATEEQLSDAIEDFSSVYPDSPFLTFLLGKNPYEVITDGDILGALEENGHILKEPAEWPAIRTWQHVCLSGLGLVDSAEFNFSPEMTCFTEHLTGDWASVLKTFRSYGFLYKHSFERVLKESGIHESAMETGYIYTPCTIRTFFGLDDGGKGFLSFSDFRRQMLGRGHLRSTTNASAYSQATPSLLVVEATGEQSCIAYEEDDSASELSSESDDSGDSDYVPSDSESDTDSDDSECSDMEIDEEAVPPKKDPETLKREALKLVADTLAYAKRWQEEHNAKKVAPAPANPFEEINSVFFRVDAIVVDDAIVRIYKQILAQQFALYCLRPEFKDLWTSNAFERLQMRSSMTFWLERTIVGEDSQTTNAIKAFLKAYPA